MSEKEILTKMLTKFFQEGKVEITPDATQEARPIGDILRADAKSASLPLFLRNRLDEKLLRNGRVAILAFSDSFKVSSDDIPDNMLAAVVNYIVYQHKLNVVDIQPYHDDMHNDPGFTFTCTL